MVQTEAQYRFVYTAIMEHVETERMRRKEETVRCCRKTFPTGTNAVDYTISHYSSSKLYNYNALTPGLESQRVAF